MENTATDRKKRHIHMQNTMESLFSNIKEKGHSTRNRNTRTHQGKYCSLVVHQIKLYKWRRRRRPKGEEKKEQEMIRIAKEEMMFDRSRFVCLNHYPLVHWILMAMAFHRSMMKHHPMESSGQKKHHQMIPFSDHLIGIEC